MTDPLPPELAARMAERVAALQAKRARNRADRAAFARNRAHGLEARKRAKLNREGTPMRKIDSTDPRFTPALDGWAECFGYRVEHTMLPTHWMVAVDENGNADVMLNPDGIRALALMAPSPDAQQVAEEIIQGMHLISHKIDNERNER